MENTIFLSSRFDNFSTINKWWGTNKVRGVGANIRKLISVPHAFETLEYVLDMQNLLKMISEGKDNILTANYCQCTHKLALHKAYAKGLNVKNLSRYDDMIVCTLNTF